MNAMNPMKKSRAKARMFGVLAGLLLMASPPDVLARSERQAPATASAPAGSELFKTYCASCHGASGRGNGAVAIFLRRPPADLTQIAKRNKGVFPADQVYEIIDGRRVVKVHGESQMPVWGDAFSKSATTEGDERTIKARIDALVKYLETIQAPAAAR